MPKFETTMYRVDTLTDKQKSELLDVYGTKVATSDGIIPVVYGVYNKETEVYEHYCANLPQALSVLGMLDDGYKQELERVQPKPKADLRSV